MSLDMSLGVGLGVGFGMSIGAEGLNHRCKWVGVDEWGRNEKSA